jgi:predicted aldo/keto reductase-like oxidoreductase
LEENVEYASRAENVPEAERQALIDRSHALKELNDLYCTNCNYCHGCPENIRIGRVFQLYLQHNIWGLSDAVRKRVASGSFGRGGGADPSACTECGACSERCPQNIDVPAELKRVWSVLRGL